MLRNIGIRSKILTVLALPVLVLLLAAAGISAGAVTDARRAGQVQTLAGQASDLTKLVRGLQAERALSVAVLTGEEGSRAALEDVRSRVSAGIESVRAGVGEVDLPLLDDAAADAVAASQRAHDQVAALRGQVDGGAISATLAAGGYADVIAADVELAGRIGDVVEDRSLAAHLRAYTAVERVAELVATERDLLAPAVAAGSMAPGLRDQATRVVAQSDASRAEAIRQAEQLGVRVPVPDYSLQMGRQRTVESPEGAIQGLTVEEWRAAADADVAALGAAGTRLSEAARERASAIADDAWVRAGQVAVLTALLVAVPLLLGLHIARSITGPLRRLTEAAGRVREELPTLVEQVQTPGEAPATSLPEIPVTSEDEIGRLAAAFNEVNAATVTVAQEQAALRGSIAAMFVNVARRDQVLLSRQLAFIDQLERTEDDPRRLENLFRLDHLATRMRRNAESLLVLAGIDTGRRLRRPMPLSDVVRTASSEIEHYQRVDLALQTDPPMVGHVALTAAHLLAELLENATQFSDPGTRVVVTTAPAPRGIVVTVTDDGLGLAEDELAEANARIADPPVAEAVGAQRLGFFVVGRLARRLDATVTLAAGSARGTIVRIELPAALFVPGSVVEIPDEEDDRDDEREDAGQVSDAAPPLPAARPAPVPEPAPAPAAPASVPQPVSHAQPAPTGAAALDILPSRSTSRRGAKPARGRFGRRAQDAVPAATPIRPITGRELRALEEAGASRVPAAASPQAHPAPPSPPVPPAVPAALPATPPPAPAPPAPPAPPAARPAPSSLFATPATGAPPPQAGGTPTARGGPAASAALPMPGAVAPPAAPPAALPTRAPQPSGHDAPVPAAAPVPVAEGMADVLRQRSALASEALTELSRLSAYSPATVDTKPPATLSRRTPAATPAAQVAPARPAGPRRTRDAADVRSMLSGFQAGVERGRTSPSDPPTDTDSATGGPA